MPSALHQRILRAPGRVGAADLVWDGLVEEGESRDSIANRLGLVSGLAGQPRADKPEVGFVRVRIETSRQAALAAVAEAAMDNWIRLEEILSAAAGLFAQPTASSGHRQERPSLAPSQQTE